MCKGGEASEPKADEVAQKAVALRLSWASLTGKSSSCAFVRQLLKSSPDSGNVPGSLK